MQHDLVADGDFVADDQREAIRVERAGVGDVQHAGVLHAGARADADAVHVAPDHRHGPHRAVLTDLHVPQHHRRAVHEGPGGEPWRMLPETSNGHDSLPHLCR